MFVCVAILSSLSIFGILVGLLKSQLTTKIVVYIYSLCYVITMLHECINKENKYNMYNHHLKIISIRCVLGLIFFIYKLIRSNHYLKNLL